MFLITAWINGIKVLFRYFWFSIVQGLLQVSVLLAIFGCLYLNGNFDKFDGNIKENEGVGLVISLLFLILLPYTFSVAAKLTGQLRGND